MKTRGLKLSTLATLCTFASLAGAQTTQGFFASDIKEVIVSSYNLKQDVLRANLNGHPVAARTASTQFFIFCDGSVRHLSERQAEQMLRPGRKVKVDLAWRNGKPIVKRALLLPSVP